MSKTSEDEQEINVLLVDDELSILDQAKIFLEKQNEKLNVETTSSAEDSLDLLDEKDYDCIVADYQMPGMNGLELLRTVRKERNNDIPFIVFTGRGREEIAMKSLNMGSDRYFQKGTDPKSQYGVLAQAIVQEVEHRKAQKKIKKLSQYPEENPHPIMRVTKEGIILYSNEAGKNILSKWEIKTMDQAPKKWQNLIKEAFNNEESRTDEIKVGEKIYSITISPVQEENYANLYGMDITERVEAEEKFRILFKRAPLPYHSLDKEGNILLVNDAWIEIFGYTKDEVIGKNISEIIHPDSIPQFEKFFPEFKKKGEAHGMKYKMKKKNGEAVKIMFDGKAEYNDDGEFERTQCILRDIKKQEKAKKDE